MSSQTETIRHWRISNLTLADKEVTNELIDFMDTTEVFRLAAHTATMDDCCSLQQLLFGAPAARPRSQSAFSRF
jgi:hypothetical protein